MNNRSCTDTVDHDKPTWLEQLWMDVQAEIDYETAHPQEPWCTCGPRPSRCVKHGDQE
jgi:hypothetical protein